jgi:tRNA A58 N-methylase Trm61
MLSPTTPTLTSYASATNNLNETGIATAVGSTAASTPSQGTGYTLSEVGIQILRYDMPPSYIQAVAGVLESGAVFKLYYPNYSSFMSTNQALPKGGTSCLIYQLNH